MATVERHAAVADAPSAPSVPAARDRTGGVAVWALLGVIAMAIAAEAWIRWILSDEFSPAPILGPDSISDGTLTALRAVEVLSVVVFAGLLWLTVIKPLRQDRRVGLDGMLFVGCLVASITDGVLNLFQYLFAWNAHSVNLGSWNSFLPLHAADSPSRYAEALVWGLPMYIYFVLGVGIAGCAIVAALRRRYPSISNAAALGVVFLAACAFDIVVENAIIQTTQAYAFAKTPASVTLWAGTTHQFPLYEMVLVGLLGTAFTALRLSASDSPDGLSFAERGLHRFRPALRRPVQWAAIIGFCVTTLFCVYHVGFNWLSSNGDSAADLPSYMLPDVNSP